MEKEKLRGGDHRTQSGAVRREPSPTPRRLTSSLVMAPWTDVRTPALPHPAHLFCILVTLPPQSPSDLQRSSNVYDSCWLGREPGSPPSSLSFSCFFRKAELLL